MRSQDNEFCQRVVVGMRSHGTPAELCGGLASSSVSECAVPHHERKMRRLCCGSNLRKNLVSGWAPKQTLSNGSQTQVHVRFRTPRRVDLKREISRFDPRNSEFFGTGPHNLSCKEVSWVSSDADDLWIMLWKGYL